MCAALCKAKAQEQSSQAERKVVEEDLLMSGNVENKHEGDHNYTVLLQQQAAWWWLFTAAEAAHTYMGGVCVQKQPSYATQ